MWQHVVLIGIVQGYCDTTEATSLTTLLASETSLDDEVMLENCRELFVANVPKVHNDQ